MNHQPIYHALDIDRTNEKGRNVRGGFVVVAENRVLRMIERNNRKTRIGQEFRGIVMTEPVTKQAMRNDDKRQVFLCDRTVLNPMNGHRPDLAVHDNLRRRLRAWRPKRSEERRVGKECRSRW